MKLQENVLFGYIPRNSKAGVNAVFILPAVVITVSPKDVNLSAFLSNRFASGVRILLITGKKAFPKFAPIVSKLPVTVLHCPAVVVLNSLHHQ